MDYQAFSALQVSKERRLINKGVLFDRCDASIYDHYKQAKEITEIIAFM